MTLLHSIIFSHAFTFCALNFFENPLASGSENVNNMPSITFLNGITGQSIVLFGFSVGNIELIIFHSLSGIIVMTDLFLFA
jgi:hypothetical protein